MRYYGEKEWLAWTNGAAGVTRVQCEMCSITSLSASLVLPSRTLTLSHSLPPTLRLPPARRCVLLLLTCHRPDAACVQLESSFHLHLTLTQLATTADNVDSRCSSTRGAEETCTATC